MTQCRLYAVHFLAVAIVHQNPSLQGENLVIYSREDDISYVLKSVGSVLYAASCCAIAGAPIDGGAIRFFQNEPQHGSVTLPLTFSALS